MKDVEEKVNGMPMVLVKSKPMVLVKSKPMVLVKSILTELETDINCSDEDLRDSLIDSVYGHGKWLYDKISRTIPEFGTLTKNQKELAKYYGYQGLFATRKTVDEAGVYLQKIIDSLDNKDKIGVVTGIQVLLNTMAIERSLGEK